jgi:hypothetical protein
MQKYPPKNTKMAYGFSPKKYKKDPSTLQKGTIRALLSFLGSFF